MLTLKKIAGRYRRCMMKEVIDPIALEGGEVAFLIDMEGKRYLDFATGFSVTAIGHCHPKVLGIITILVRKDLMKREKLTLAHLPR